MQKQIKNNWIMTLNSGLSPTDDITGVSPVGDHIPHWGAWWPLQQWTGIPKRYLSRPLPVRHAQKATETLPDHTNKSPRSPPQPEQSKLLSIVLPDLLCPALLHSSHSSHHHAVPHSVVCSYWKFCLCNGGITKLSSIHKTHHCLFWSFHRCR